jgi:TPP-dependent 2-oxoacid decarboxylase
MPAAPDPAEARRRLEGLARKRRGLDPVVFVLNNDGYTVERAINGQNA